MIVSLNARVSREEIRHPRSWWRTQPLQPRPGPGLVVATVAAMAAYAAAAGTVLDAIGRAVAAVLLVGGATLIARRAGIGRIELGLTGPPGGLSWGLAVGLPVAGAIVLLSFIPVTETLFSADRYGQMAGGDVLFRAAVRIPLGTALFEEYLFRGVLLALLLRRHTPATAVVASSLLFGAWHLLTAFGDARTGGVGWDASVIVPLTLAATAAAGAFLAWLRIRARSLMAPFLVHALANSTALVAAHLAVGRGGAG